MKQIGIIALVVLAFVLGWGQGQQKAPELRVVERTDTLWQVIHDTTFVATVRNVERKDTVLLARVDTLQTTDSVFVEVPIERQVWAGQYYQITTEGYRVALKDVTLAIPTIEKEVTKTIVKQRHWSWGVGAQAGYGMTLHGASPYIGVGISAGYNF